MTWFTSMIQESLCVQFWDRDSFIDGPIRCLLYNLEGEFPYRTVELISLLSALSEGAWPAECVWVPKLLCLKDFLYFSKFNWSDHFRIHVMPFKPMNRYSFLDKSVGLSTLVELSGNHGTNNNARIIETRLPLRVPGFDGLQIPRDTRGHVLKFIDDNTALVRWEVSKLFCWPFSIVYLQKLLMVLFYVYCIYTVMSLGI